MRSYRSSHRIRVNANGKLVDAWLIYKCTACDNTWNRPILERRPVKSIDPLLLASLTANDATLADRLAFDVEGLKRWAPQLDHAADAVVAKDVLSGSPVQPGELRILCTVPHPVTLRLDRLLADELQISRSRIQALERSGALDIHPGASRILRKPVRDGTKLRLKLPVQSADWVAQSAARNRALLTGRET